MYSHHSAPIAQHQLQDPRHLELERLHDARLGYHRPDGEDGRGIVRELVRGDAHGREDHENVREPAEFLWVGWRSVLVHNRKKAGMGRCQPRGERTKKTAPEEENAHERQENLKHICKVRTCPRIIPAIVHITEFGQPLPSDTRPERCCRCALCSLDRSLAVENGHEDRGVVCSFYPQKVHRPEPNFARRALLRSFHIRARYSVAGVSRNCNV